jgi:hypothetical protein
MPEVPDQRGCRRHQPHLPPRCQRLFEFTEYESGFAGAWSASDEFHAERWRRKGE